MNRTTVGGPELGGGRGAGGVVVLVDPARAGRSPVAALLATELHPSVHLRTDDFLRVIRRGQLPPHLPEAERQNTTALAAAAQAAFAYATGGYQVVVECPAVPALDTFRRESRTTGAALHYVVLDPAPGRHTVDPTTLTPETTTKAVLAALATGTHLLGW
ncbi:ATP-binding protein [Streptomyces kaniharaensis]|uniref:ATP-binding protein n=1 Tax=Streptomyces kaniharaensis TaxID=212423 RepID=A0A6N7KHY8_9ACTN|nr:ATP-binding protein [Streptomyces kaniharaensis]MQS11102.1 ATP-binding protein [Streptomyces kaniharaensis]